MTKEELKNILIIKFPNARVSIPDDREDVCVDFGGDEWTWLTKYYRPDGKGLVFGANCQNGERFSHDLHIQA